MVVVFDLDDTLYPEIEYLKSAYRAIASMTGHDDAYGLMLQTFHDGGNAFAAVIERYHPGFTVDDLIRVYRSHKPHISLDEDTRLTLSQLKGTATMGLISDGRAMQQRHKIEALGLYGFIPRDNIIISEEFGHKKPDPDAFRFFMDKYPGERFAYVGDNTQKDFIAPNRLGWLTVCLLDHGVNIHPQDFSLPGEFLPQYKVSRLSAALHILSPKPLQAPSPSKPPRRGGMLKW